MIEAGFLKFCLIEVPIMEVFVSYGSYHQFRLKEICLIAVRMIEVRFIGIFLIVVWMIEIWLNTLTPPLPLDYTTVQQQ